MSRIRPFCGRILLDQRLRINDLAVAAGGENAAKLLNLTVPGGVSLPGGASQLRPVFPMGRRNREGDQRKKGQKSNPTAHDISPWTPNTVLVRPVCTSTCRIVDLIPEEFDHLHYFGM